MKRIIIRLISQSTCIKTATMGLLLITMLVLSVSWCFGEINLGKNVIVAFLVLNRNPRVEYVDVTVTTGIEDDIYKVTGKNMLGIALKPFIKGKDAGLKKWE